MVAGAAGVGIGLYIKKRNAGGSFADDNAYIDPGSDMAGYPYAAETTGIGGGLGGGGGGAPSLDGGYLPAAPLEEGLPGYGGALAPVVTQLPNERVPVGGSPGNCPPNYYWNGVLCMPKVVAGSARMQPGATAPASAGQARRCPHGWHWNGFDCVPDSAAPSPTRRALEQRLFG